MTISQLSNFYLTKQLTLSTYIYSTAEKLWCMLGELSEFNIYIPEEPKASIERAEYFFFNDGEVCGPYRMSEVITLVNAREISLYNYIYGDKDNRWQIILKHPDFQNFLPRKPIDDPVLLSEDSTTSKVTMQTELRDESFSPAKVVKYDSTNRLYDRAPYNSAVQIEKKDLKIAGLCTEIGIGGAFIESNWRDLQIDDVIDVRILPGLVPLNIETAARIVSLFSHRKKGVGIQFLDLNFNTQTEIKDFVDKYLTKNQRRSL